MLAVDRALLYLEETAGFGRALEELVVRRGGWPNRWLTPAQIHTELTARGFWTGARAKVHPDARVRLLTRYLDHLVDHPGQAMDNAGLGLTSPQPLDDSAASAAGLGISGSDAQASSVAGATAVPFATGGWKRFDGQYKHNPRTRLIEYRGNSTSKQFDRRSFERINVQGVSCQYGPVLDMSLLGLRFLAEREVGIEVGHRGYVRLSYGTIHLRMRVKCCWASCGKDGPLIGVEYRQLSLDDQATLQRILADAAITD